MKTNKEYFEKKWFADKPKFTLSDYFAMASLMMSEIEKLQKIEDEKKIAIPQGEYLNENK